MTTYNFCKRMDVQTKIAIDRWARRLEADEVTVHRDGSITLTCKDGYICNNYKPSAQELYGKYKAVI